MQLLHRRLHFRSSPASPADYIAYYKFDDGSGTNANDSSANNYDGTLVNTPTWSNSVPAAITFANPYCLLFDGTNRRVSLPTFSGGTTFSISCWIKISSLTWSYIIDASAGRWVLGISDASPQGICIYDGSWHTGTATVADGNWHNVIAIANTGGKTYTYIDGVKDMDITATSKELSGTKAVGSKYDGTEAYWTGPIDDLRIYSRALTASEIALIAGGY